MTREQSFSVALSSGEEQKKSAQELENVRKSLAQAHFTIAELRVALAEANERCDELSNELVAQQMADLPGMGGALSMVSNLTEVSLERPPPLKSMKSVLRYTSVVSAGRAEAQKHELLCRWPDLRADRSLPAVAEEKLASVSSTQKGGAAPAGAKKETLDFLLSKVSKEGGVFALLRHGMAIFVASIVTLRLLVFFVFQ